MNISKCSFPLLIFLKLNIFEVAVASYMQGPICFCSLIFLQGVLPILFVEKVLSSIFINPKRFKSIIKLPCKLQVVYQYLLGMSKQKRITRHFRNLLGMVDTLSSLRGDIWIRNISSATTFNIFVNHSSKFATSKCKDLSSSVPLVRKLFVSGVHINTDICERIHHLVKI